MTTDRQDRPRTLRSVISTEWAELGPLGRTALIALALAAVVAVVLGVSIPRQVESHLIDGEIRTISRIADGMVRAGMIPPDPTNEADLVTLDETVRLDLLGHETVRVKIWLPDGTIAYSDEPALIGKTFALSEDIRDGFAGIPRTDVPNLAKPENEYERALPPLREFYIPVASEGGEVTSVFEVYHLAEPIDTTVGDIKRYVWISIAVGIGLLAVFIATLIIVNGIAVTRRRRQAEQLFADLVKAQADERQRIIGALHDDIGQSLYRIHYGLEDSRGRVDPDDPLAGELARLDDIVLEVDESLRQELRTLHHGSVEEIGLGAALDELAEITEAESDLTVDVDVIHDCTLTSTGRVALYRAAREAVTNARKHALATAVDVRVERRHDRVQVQVLDDGIGFDGDEGLGLTTTRERLEAIGGGLRVGTARQGGTRVRAWVPAGQCGGHQ